MTSAPREGIAEACTTPRTATSVMLWGDSHMQQFAPGLAAAMPAGISLLQVATSACPPDVGNQDGRFPACQRSNRFAFQTIARVKPTVVILSQRTDHLKTNWARLATEIRAVGVRSVILLGPIPTWDRDLAKIVAREFWPSPPERMRTGMVVDRVSLDASLSRDLGTSPDLIYVSIMRNMCTPDGCKAFIGPGLYEDLVTFDYGHLTPAASRYLAETVLMPLILREVGNRAN
jgi:hypothetical protein